MNTFPTCTLQSGTTLEGSGISSLKGGCAQTCTSKRALQTHVISLPDCVEGGGMVG